MTVPTLQITRMSRAAALLLWVAMLPSATAASHEGGRGPDAGLRVMGDVNAGNCVSCHQVPGVSGLQGRLGPSLEGVGRRYGASQLRQWVTDARVLNPDTLMPPFGTVTGLNRPSPARPVLDAEQIEQVVAALLSFR